jgi:hypothetical protein
MREKGKEREEGKCLCERERGTERFVNKVNLLVGLHRTRNEKSR